MLVDELGTEPGAELRELHRQILQADGRSAGGPVGGQREPRIPRELPGPVRPFVGREAELAALTRRLDEDGTVVISAVAAGALAP